MPAPILAAAGKVLLKQAAKKAAVSAAKKASGKGGGNDDNDRAKVVMAIVAAGLVIILVFGVGMVQGLMKGMQVFFPDPNGAAGQCYNIPDLTEDMIDENGELKGDYIPVSEGGTGGGTSTGSGMISGVPENSGKVVMPLEILPGHQISSPYGYRGYVLPGVDPFHTGTDFKNHVGTRTRIFSAADGVVLKTQYESGSGNSVYIQHNIGGVNYIGRYVHMSSAHNQFVKAGDTVRAGQQIGFMGETGTWTTGVHLHFEIWTGTSRNTSTNSLTWLQSNGAVSLSAPLPGSPLDPSAPGALPGAGSITEIEYCMQGNGSYTTSTKYGGGGAGPWGGHQNGQIPASALCAVDFSGGHRLRCDATSALVSLNADFKAQFGRNIQITDSYRSYDAQVQCRQNKGSLCATPGTSNHGWGLAIDLGSNINNFGTAEYNWMLANASKHGWTNPDWARQNGSKPEPWHWEYTGNSAVVVGPDAGRTAETAKVLAQQIMRSEYGWSGSNEFQCLNNLWSRESSWNYRAANPTSSAYGIPQAMMSVHFGGKTSAAAQNYMNNPDVQIRWGLNYIKGRYGSPCGAWSHSQSHNWY